MSDTMPVTFEVANVRRIKKGVWLADVHLDLDGVPITLRGFRVVQESPTAKSVELPSYVDRGTWRLAVELPIELREPIARAIVGEIQATP